MIMRNNAKFTFTIKSERIMAIQYLLADLPLRKKSILLNTWSIGFAVVLNDKFQGFHQVTTSTLK